MEVLFIAAPVAVIAIAVVAFNRFWPSAPDASPTTPSSTLLTSSPRQLTTGQVARGVFWGMWLFWLSQIIVAGVVMVLALGVGGAMVRSALGG